MDTPVKHATWEGAKRALHGLKDLAKQNPDLKKRIECLEKLDHGYRKRSAKLDQSDRGSTGQEANGCLAAAWQKGIKNSVNGTKTESRDITNQLLKHIPYRP